MKKKLLLALWVIVLSLLVFGTISASAETEGIYTYSVSNGTAIITGCDESVMGNVVIPNTLGGYPVTSIGSHAFSHCSGIMNITIPDSVTYIGVCAFYNCTGLKSITLSDNVKTLDSAAFQDCTGLTEVVIGNGITKINKETFYRCTGLTTVTLGNSITSIGKDAFYDCENIKDVYITDLSAWCNINFYDPSPFPGDIPNPLYYGANLYLNDVLVTELVIPDGITEIKRHAFRGCESIKSVVIPGY